MAYYVQKPSIINPDAVVYYAGDKRWTDDPSQKVKFSTKKAANAVNDEKIGGWKGITVVSE